MKKFLLTLLFFSLLIGNSIFTAVYAYDSSSNAVWYEPSTATIEVGETIDFICKKGDGVYPGGTATFGTTGDDCVYAKMTKGYNFSVTGVQEGVFTFYLNFSSGYSASFTVKVVGGDADKPSENPEDPSETPDDSPSEIPDDTPTETPDENPPEQKPEEKPNYEFNIGLKNQQVVAGQDFSIRYEMKPYNSKIFNALIVETKDTDIISIKRIYGNVEVAGGKALKAGTATITIYDPENRVSPQTIQVKVLDPEDIPSTISVYRLYNNRNGEHLYTADYNEYRVLIESGRDWEGEGIAWKSPTSGEGIYRLYSPVTGFHLFTSDRDEVNHLASSGWSVDNSGSPLFYSGGDTAVYRLYNAQLSQHLLTKDYHEYSTLKELGWTQEGQKFNAYSN